MRHTANATTALLAVSVKSALVAISISSEAHFINHSDEVNQLVACPS